MIDGRDLSCDIPATDVGVYVDWDAARVLMQNFGSSEVTVSPPWAFRPVTIARGGFVAWFNVDPKWLSRLSSSRRL